MEDLSNRYKRKHQSEELDGRKVRQKKYDDGAEPKTGTKNPSETAKPSSNLKRSFDKSQASRRISKLILALDEVLEEDGRDETLDFIGDEALKRCLKLQKALSHHRSKIDASPINAFTNSQPISADFQNIPKSLSPTSITAWKSSTIPTSFPPKPNILDPTLEASTFIHQGLGSGAPTDLNYERLEWIGDAYIELIASLLISKTFPSLGPGKSSQIRERLVKNSTLAKYACYYSLDQQAQLPKSLAFAAAEEKVKIHGDIFEAYVAAVILSDPKDGLRKASDWLKDLWGMELAKEIINEERMGIKFDSPMWRLRGTGEPIQIMAPIVQPLKPKEQLQKMIACKVAKLTYKDAAPQKKDHENKLALFTVGVYLDGWGEKDKRLGIGEAHGKKEAGSKAASMALKNKQVMDVYAEKKRAWEVQNALEQERREKGDGI